eukprot:6039903-Prymnesium_polylepis.1
MRPHVHVHATLPPLLQGARIYWSDYQGAHTYPGQVVMNICLVGTVGLGLTAGVYQGINEEKLRKQRPDAFAPGAALASQPSDLLPGYLVQLWCGPTRPVLLPLSSELMRSTHPTLA